MKRTLFCLFLPFFIAGCELPVSKTIYTVTSLHPKGDGTVEYLMVSEKGDKLIVNKNNQILWEIGNKICIEGIPSQ